MIKQIWDKIKGWTIAIAGAVIAFLFMALGLKNNKIEKQEKTINSLQQQKKTMEHETKMVSVAVESEKEVSKELDTVTQKEVDSIEGITTGKIEYDTIIEGWNNEIKKR